MLELYHSALSPCAQKVRLCLAEKKLEWRGHLLNLAEKDNLRPEYLVLNPKGVVPTLVDNGTPIIESTLINEYLDEKYPEPSLKLADPVARARMRLWPKLVDEEVHPANGGLAWPILVRPALLKKSRAEIAALMEKVPDAKRRARQERLLELGFDAPDAVESIKVFVKTFDAAEQALEENERLAGDRFSLADISLLPYLQTVAQFRMSEMFESGRPALAAWWARCRARPSFAAAILTQAPADRWAAIAEAGAQIWPKLRGNIVA